ncbi:MAG: sigma-54 dependent transcriptional regulator [Syntrophobacteraceae bacterium]|nr:sigma-54 dependent transcriptional regulator [Desulfobacteraceae bacterium]
MNLLPRSITAKFNAVFDMRSVPIWMKLLIALVPCTLVLLIAAGLTTNRVSGQFLDDVVRKNVQIRATALANEVGIFLSNRREDLLMLGYKQITGEGLYDFWRSRQKAYGWGYEAVAYLTTDPEQCIYLVRRGKDAVMIPKGDIQQVRPDPRLDLNEIPRPEDGILVSSVIETSYPIKDAEQLSPSVSKNVIRFMNLVLRHGVPEGLLLLEVDITQIRDILGKFGSSMSSLNISESKEPQHSFFFSLDGWLWFSPDETKGAPPRFSPLAPNGFPGRFGILGHSSTFRPSREQAEYWRMVYEVRSGSSGVIMLPDQDPESKADNYYMGYAPVRVHTGPDLSHKIFGGVAIVDHSSQEGHRQSILILLTAGLCAIVLSLVVYIVSRALTRPVLALTNELDRACATGQLADIETPGRDLETSLLTRSVNRLFSVIREQTQELTLKDRLLLMSSESERVRLEEEIKNLKRKFLAVDIEEILGYTPVLESLKLEIIKASSIDADVLILGETGTGKQLAAEVIHRLSGRSRKPFITVNCGGLDENLLLDELFGHVKGAFTEARADRRGAFLAADGGILFLDEIGNASPRVQQSLLRALSARRISPLGTDAEYDVDVRVIAATNEDLLEMVENGKFREDLYYRLKVITIRIPPLRSRRDDILVLANHFLNDAAIQMGRKDIGLTRGALEKLKAHDWPGNVRELRNCITRAVAMAESSLIYTDDIQLDDGDFPAPARPQAGFKAPAPSVPVPTGVECRIPEGVVLNERQREAVSLVLKHEEISRSDYQKLMGKDLPKRTAAHDLQDLVRKGVLEMTGRGPATRYRLARSRQTSEPPTSG